MLVKLSMKEFLTSWMRHLLIGKNYLYTCLGGLLPIRRGAPVPIINSPVRYTSSLPLQAPSNTHIELDGTFAFKALQVKDGTEWIEDGFGAFTQCTYTKSYDDEAEAAAAVWRDSNFDDYYKWMVRTVGDFVCYC